MEKAVLMLDYLNVSQKANGSFSHQGDKALDLSGKDSSVSDLKAPFTGTIKRIYPTANAVWLESNDKVKYADGTIDYMTVLTIHDNDVSNLYVGKVINQGEVYYQEGTRGYATGNHIHLTVGKGKYTANGWYKNSNGNWVINNQYDVHKALFLSNSVNVINGGGYNWIRTNSLKEQTSNNSNNNNYYTVVKGDTLYMLARRFNTTINELAKINNIKNVNLISIGQKLIIPSYKEEYFKKYTGSTLSIVDALKSIGENSSFNYRTSVAQVNGISNYVGTTVQNTQLLKLLKEGLLIKP